MMKRDKLIFWGANPMHDKYEILATVERMKAEHRRENARNPELYKARQLEQKNKKSNDP
jgi:hypothetical protein